MTSFSASLGTWTYRVSPGLASVGLKVMRFTVRSAFIAPRTFSECEGSRLGGTAMVYIVFSKLICILVMAEGGYDPTDPTNEKTPLIPDTGDNDDDAWDNVNWNTPVDPDRTQPFEPGAASTPAGGESIPMTTRTRLPQERGDLIDETSFGGDEPTGRMAWHEIIGKFEMADEANLRRVTKRNPEQVGVVAGLYSRSR